MRITREFEFCAAHMLSKHFGKCKNVHGHNYTVFVTIIGEMDLETGMVMDFGAVKELVTPILEEMDHSFLVTNTTPESLVTCLTTLGSKMFNLDCGTSAEATAENIAQHIRGTVKQKLNLLYHFMDVGVKVRVYETSQSYAECSE